MSAPWIFLLATSLASAAPSKLPKDLQDFLGPPPPGFERNFLKSAQQLHTALDHRAKHQLDAAITGLRPLAEQGEYAEHATFELALALQEKKDFAKSTAQAQRIMHEFPGSVYGDRVPDLIRDNDCAQALAESKGKASKARKVTFLERCLNKSPWKEWGKRSEQVDALYALLSSTKDPLFGAFVAEVIQAMPASSPIRAKIAKEIPNTKLEEYADVARYRMKSPNPAGVKAVYPDAELFDQGMQAVLKEKWAEANSAFKKLASDYPQSERIDSAGYWIARTEEKLGNADTAKAKYEQILADSPLSYYGLQSALRLKKDPKGLLQNPEARKTPRLAGALLTRQALSLWRMRGLLEAGLIDQAREEAKFFFQYRPGGATFGQEDPLGAVMTAKLYSAAGYPLAAFSHAYTAMSFDRSLFTPETLALIFPRNFEEDFLAAAGVSGVHPDLLFSVAKQESAFIPNALSRADALGLLQLLPVTAQEMKSDLKREELFDPAVNTMLGGQYLRKLLDRFQGNIGLALAGYNAGPSRAQQWQRQLLESPMMKNSFDVDAFIDFIPFTETRKYVGNILRNYAWYKLLANDGSIESIQELAFQWQKPVKKIEKTPEPETTPSEAPTPPPSPSTPKSSDTSDPTAGS